MRRILGLCLVLTLLLAGGEAQAGELAERLGQFPDWKSKPPVTAATGDLVYPTWMKGTWKVTSTLIEQIAPLAPEIVTPGFEGNRNHLQEPISFLVRFQQVGKSSSGLGDWFIPFRTRRSRKNRSVLKPTSEVVAEEVVADRAFNGLNIARAYLGDRIIRAVKVDPNSPNRQVTILRTGSQLVSVITGRASEIPAPDQFNATEVVNQVFRGTRRPFFNEVETTTAYQFHQSPTPIIKADQVTAVYLSPQDPDYFKALEKPVALYRYQLELVPVKDS
ncbi:DUF6816 family protein [Moorena sp. SIO3B2]|uniref:DUF6816 family protein n=1 Tax=Moorena sp. SIO3B2 TaxID=2607827 RepID=UPI00257DBDB6|nr:hypothetical protein [Moorena sp. SIO3B2]